MFSKILWEIVQILEFAFNNANTFYVSDRADRIGHFLADYAYHVDIDMLQVPFIRSMLDWAGFLSSLGL